MFTLKDITELRSQTGVGMQACKDALTACDGNMEKAVVYLREKGIATAAKKESRIASQGIVESYIHMGGKIGVLVEVNCETDFVARGDAFKLFVKDIAMQIAAAKPAFLVKAEVPADIIEKEKEILMAQIANDPAMAKKPDMVKEKMIVGRIEKYYKENCLMEQEFVKDSSMTITQYLNSVIAAIGEKISIRRYTRYEMGEGLAKKEDNFVSEIMDAVAAMKK